MNLSRRRFIYSAALGLMVPYVRASVPVPFAFFKPAATGYDTEVLDWISRVVANGGSVSQSTKDAANTFMLALKANGLRSTIARLNLYAGTGLDACRTPLIKDIGAATDTLNNFVAGDYSESTGLTGNGTTKYNDTGTTLAQLQAFSGPFLQLPAALGAYVRTSSAVASEAVMGCFTATASRFTYLYTNSGNAHFAFTDLANEIGAVDATGTGFYLGARANDAAGSGKLYRNGSQIGTSANLGSCIFDAINMYVHAFNHDGTGPVSFTAQAIAGYQLARLFDATQQANLYTAWQAFQTALGRQV
jgi:hypothetical protein